VVTSCAPFVGRLCMPGAGRHRQGPCSIFPALDHRGDRNVERDERDAVRPAALDPKRTSWRVHEFGRIGLGSFRATRTASLGETMADEAQSLA